MTPEEQKSLLNNSRNNNFNISHLWNILLFQE
jgi:hypothetical protein